RRRRRPGRAADLADRAVAEVEEPAVLALDLDDLAVDDLAADGHPARVLGRMPGRRAEQGADDGDADREPLEGPRHPGPGVAQALGAIGGASGADASPPGALDDARARGPHASRTRGRRTRGRRRRGRRRRARRAELAGVPAWRPRTRPRPGVLAARAPRVA